MTTRVPHRPAAASDDGYAMAALLIALSVMAIMMSVALPNWRTLSQREKEAELVFRGEQYARAIAMFQREFGGAFPPDIDVLVTERFLRKAYKDPITGQDFEVITPGTEIEGIDPETLGGEAGRQSGDRASGRAGRAGGGAERGRGSSTLSRESGMESSRGRGTGSRGGSRTGRGRGDGRGSNRGSAAPLGASTGVQGVRSTSTEESLRIYNGAERYDQWLFIATENTLAAGAGAAGAGAPGVDGEEAGRSEAGRGRGRGGRGEAGRGGRRGRGDAGPGGRGGGRGRDGGGGRGRRGRGARGF